MCFDKWNVECWFDSLYEYCMRFFDFVGDDVEGLVVFVEKEYVDGVGVVEYCFGVLCLVVVCVVCGEIFGVYVSFGFDDVFGGDVFF